MRPPATFRENDHPDNLTDSDTETLRRSDTRSKPGCVAFCNLAPEATWCHFCHSHRPTHFPREGTETPPLNGGTSAPRFQKSRGRLVMPSLGNITAVSTKLAKLICDLRKGGCGDP